MQAIDVVHGVDVEVQEAHGLTAAPRPVEGQFELAAQRAPVAEPGERVGLGQPLDLPRVGE